MATGKKGNRISLYTLLGIILLTAAHYFSKRDVWSICWDTAGYYLYLPQLFIEGDVTLEHPEVPQKIFKEKNLSGTFYQAYYNDKQLWVYKYSIGMAILFLPFFLIGHLIALVGGWPADGYSAPYHHAIFLGGLIYTLLGFGILRRMLLRWFPDLAVAVAMVITVLGTNLAVMMKVSPAMPHCYLLGVYAIILWLTARWHEKPRTITAVALACTCSITILSRPSEIVCLLIPLLWGVSSIATLKEKWKLIWKTKWQWILAGCVAAIPVALQILLWKATADEWIYYSYHYPEEMRLVSPFFSEFLFSYRKGWLLYTPIMLFGIAGFFFLRKQKTVFAALLVFFVINLWFVSSWTVWWYAESFGSRAILQSYAVMLFPLTALLAWAYAKRIRGILVSIPLVLLFAFNLFQTWQFEHGVIDASRMTKEYYWFAFGKTKVSYEDKRQRLLLIRDDEGIERFTPDSTYELKKVFTLSWDDANSKDSIAHVFEGSGSIALTPESPFTPANTFTYSDIAEGADHFWVKASVWLYSDDSLAIADPRLVVHFEGKGGGKGKVYKYKAVQLPPGIPSHKWVKLEKDYLTPEVRSSDEDFFNSYLWLAGPGTVYADEFRLEFYAPVKR